MSNHNLVHLQGYECCLSKTANSHAWPELGDHVSSCLQLFSIQIESTQKLEGAFKIFGLKAKHHHHCNWVPLSWEQFLVEYN